MRRFVPRFGIVGSDVGQINEVALRRARLVLGWVTTLVQKIFLGLTNHPGQLSLAIPAWVGAMSTGQRTVMLCSYGEKASMVRVWWQVKLCDPLYNTCHI